MTTSPLNTDLLTRVRDAIAAEDPEHFDMKAWADALNLSGKAEFCNTALCIGGWTLRLGGDKLDQEMLLVEAGVGITARRREALRAALVQARRGNIAERASELLGLTDPSHPLFYTVDWPEKYQTEIKEAERDNALALLDELIAGRDPWA